MKGILTLQKLKSSLIQAVEDAEYYDREARTRLEDAEYYDREARTRLAVVEDLRRAIEVLEAAAAGK